MPEHHDNHLCATCSAKFALHAGPGNPHAVENACPPPRPFPKWPTTIRDEERAGKLFDEFEPDEIAVAEQWHGGQSSMLYAMASTGALSCGTERFRPRVDCDACGCRGWATPSDPCGACRGAKMTDAQWLAYLADKLVSEAEECIDKVRDSHWGVADPGDIETLEGIAAKCRATIAELGATT